MNASTPKCGWCDEPAITEVVTRPGRKNKQTAPVCEAHAKHFEDQGVMTIRLEFDKKEEAQRKRRQWLKEHRPWPSR